MTAAPNHGEKTSHKATPVTENQTHAPERPDPSPVTGLGPPPRKVPLPLGGDALMYTRENLTQLFKCSHGELGRLASRKMCPLPIRIDGQILWYVDECLAAQAQVMRSLERWRKR